VADEVLVDDVAAESAPDTAGPTPD
jgi:hypothetical protein